MMRLPPRRRRRRLDAKSYRELRQEVLTRDGWRCQQCGRATDLQVHHILSRGGLGEDDEKNLITLCASCHWNAHR